MDEPKWNTCSGEDVWNTQSLCSISGCSQKEFIIRYQDPKRRKWDQWTILWQTNTHKWRGGAGHTAVFSSPCSPCPVIIMWSAKVGLGVRWEGSTDLIRRSYGKCCTRELGLCFTHPVLPQHWVLCETLQSLGFSSKSSQWEWGCGWRFKWSKTGHERITAEARLWAYESLS